MELRDIVERDLRTPITDVESYLVIRECVKRRKGVHINPTIDTSFGLFKVRREIELMNRMTLMAILWFRENGVD